MKEYKKESSIADVMADPAFGSYGRLVFSAGSGFYSGDTLGSLRLTWYNNVDPDETVEIVNDMKEHAHAGPSSGAGAAVCSGENTPWRATCICSPPTGVSFSCRCIWDFTGI